MTFNPEEWTPRKRASFMAHALTEFLDVVPTERSTWMPDADERVPKQEAKARRISDLMDQVHPGLK